MPPRLRPVEIMALSLMGGLAGIACMGAAYLTIFWGARAGAHVEAACRFIGLM